MAGPHIAELIDGLLATRKTISGEPDWQDTYNNQARLIMPLAVEGVSCGADLKVIAYPIDGHSKYSILVCAPKCIWRVDYVTGEPHVNSLSRPDDLSEADINGPHYHSWPDNRRFATHSSLPDRLENARILPAGLQTFDSTFRWFCGETNIDQPPTGLISLPSRMRLL